MQGLHVRDIMTTPVVTLEQGHSIHMAASIMRLQHFRHLPVVDAKKQFVGLVTHRDLLSAQADVLARGSRKPEILAVPVARIMRVGVWTVHRETPVMEAARIMFDHKFGCLPVLDGRELVGIVTEADLLHAFLSVLERNREWQDTDPNIRDGGALQ
jgi:CBS domain-containing membrane protein